MSAVITFTATEEAGRLKLCIFCFIGYSEQGCGAEAPKVMEAVTRELSLPACNLARVADNFPENRVVIKALYNLVLQYRIQAVEGPSAVGSKKWTLDVICSSI